MRPSSTSNSRYCCAAAMGLLRSCPSNKRAASAMSSPRTPTSGLAASVCCTACSRALLSASSSGSSVMVRGFMGIGLADEQAKELGNESGFCLAFDLERAIEPEQHAVLALRLNREQ